MKKKKESKRKITIAISKELIELIQKEAIKEKTTNTAIYYKILEKYFENKDKISIDSMCEEEKKYISIRLPEKYAKLMHITAFEQKVTKVAFLEALIKDYFAISDK